MILSGAIDIVPDVDVVVKINVETEVISVEINGTEVYNSDAI